MTKLIEKYNRAIKGEIAEKMAAKLIEQIASMAKRDESDDPDQGWELEACETLDWVIEECRRLRDTNKPPRPGSISHAPHAPCRDLNENDSQ